MTVSIEPTITNLELGLHDDLLCLMDRIWDVGVGVDAAAVEFTLWHYVVDGQGVALGPNALLLYVLLRVV
jgi:hypothetical protein